MARLTWREPSDPEGALFGWRLPSMALASLFLNFYFWYFPANRFWFLGPPAIYLLALALLTYSVSILLFLGPALACYEKRKSIFQVAESSFGSIPAIALRVAVSALCMLWITGTAGALIFGFLRAMLQRRLDAVEVALVSGLLVTFLFATGLQNMRTSAKMAFFTNKLAVALLIAAAIRVRRYLPEAWADLFRPATGAEGLWARIAWPLMFLGPMALLAADYASVVKRRKDVELIGLMGLVVPLTCTLIAVGLIQSAAYHWRPDLGGLVNIALPLWGGDSNSYVPYWTILAMITMFGYARFCVRMWDRAVSPLRRWPKAWWAVCVGTLLAAASLAASESEIITRGIQFSAGLAACVAAVLSADYAIRRRMPAGPTRPVDLLALGSVAVGYAAGALASFLGGADYSFSLSTSILAAYAATFVFCIAGRRIQRGAS